MNVLHAANAPHLVTCSPSRLTRVQPWTDQGPCLRRRPPEGPGPCLLDATPVRPTGPQARAAAPVRAKDGLLIKDELVGMGLRAKDVSTFAPLFEDGGLSTAANVAAEGDGVASLLIASADRAAALGLVPLARFVSFATAGASPAIWPVASIVATGRALALAGLVVADIDHFEINESSAAAVLAWMAAVGADPARRTPRAARSPGRLRKVPWERVCSWRQSQASSSERSSEPW